LSADAGSIFLIQILEYILYRYHVTILGVYIVEGCPVGVGVAVADGFARYDRPEAVPTTELSPTLEVPGASS
jgi:tetrahydrodipicolinate N-succinyltransferase